MSDFERRTREILADSAERLDGHTRSRLTRARHAALAQLEGRKGREGAWLPLGAAAAAVLVAGSWLFGTKLERDPAGDGIPVAAVTPGPLEDIDLLADAEAPDFVADLDELEFYEWAAGEVDS